MKFYFCHDKNVFVICSTKKPSVLIPLRVTTKWSDDAFMVTFMTLWISLQSGINLTLV